MPYRTTAKNVMLEELRTVVATCSVHNAYPPSDANEIAATNGARQTITFGAAANGAMTTTNQPQFDVPAGTTVSSVAYRNAAGEILADDDVPDETFTGAGVYRITSTSMDLNG